MGRRARDVLAFKLQATNELLTANAGLAVFGEFFHGVGYHAGWIYACPHRAVHGAMHPSTAWRRSC